MNEAKYHGVIKVGTKDVCIQQLLGELYFHVEASNILQYDNQSAMQVIDNPATHSKMKHVEIYFYYLR